MALQIHTRYSATDALDQFVFRISRRSSIVHAVAFASVCASFILECPSLSVKLAVKQQLCASLETISYFIISLVKPDTPLYSAHKMFVLLADTLSYLYKK